MITQSGQSYEYNCEWCGKAAARDPENDLYPFCSLEHLTLFSDEESAREAWIDEQIALIGANKMNNPNQPLIDLFNGGLPFKQQLEILAIRHRLAREHNLPNVGWSSFSLEQRELLHQLTLQAISRWQAERGQPR